MTVAARSARFAHGIYEQSESALIGSDEWALDNNREEDAIAVSSVSGPAIPASRASGPGPAVGRQRARERLPDQPLPDLTWRRMDLHIHTPASVDYQESDVPVLQILQTAEQKGLDVIALTDHNSVRGYADLWREIEDLELLEYLNRLQPSEAARLAEYRRLLGKILVLPGFEFTATFGFHILAIFPETTSVRLMEHLLLTLGVPEDRFGSGEVGATTDVLRAYEILDAHGALVIGAHVNSTHGIAMQGLRFGGQTKIAYTQDPHLHALEVTDLMVNGGRRSTARFFSGIKPEYPRRMHCIQGSDAHRLNRDPQRETNLGVGDRATEVLLPEVSFNALKSLLLSEHFDRTRPYVGEHEAVRLLRDARAEGNTSSQVFYENLSTKRAGLAHVLRDTVAFANADGGTIYLGVSAFEKRPVVGIADPEKAEAELRAELERQVTPLPEIETEIVKSDSKNVLVVRVAAGAEKPYALAPGNIFVREGAESVLASRDQIVAMVRAMGAAGPESANGSTRAGAVWEPTPSANGTAAAVAAPESLPRPEVAPRLPAMPDGGPERHEPAGPDPIAPTSGVEIVGMAEKDGQRYYSVYDLRHREYVHNVTRTTGRRLWRYAIEQFEDRPVDEESVRWNGNFGFVRSYRPRGGERRFNLAYREDGELRIFYGVADENLRDEWRALLAVP